MRNFLVVKFEDKKSVMSHRYKWKYKVITNFKDTMWYVCNWITLDQVGNQWQVLGNRILNP